MIICKNCGAEFDVKALKCPFCGHENAAAAQEEYHKKMDALVKEREEINKLPKRVVNKAAVVFAVMVAVFVIAGIAVPVVWARTEVKRQEEFMEKRFQLLDDYLENGQYQEFYDLYKEVKEPLDYYGYQEVYYACELYIDIKELVEETMARTDETDNEHMIYIISDILYRIKRLNDYVMDNRDDKTLYGNEKYLEDIFITSKEYVLKVSPVDSQSLEAVFAYTEKDKIYEFCKDYARIIVEGLE